MLRSKPCAVVTSLLTTYARVGACPPIASAN